MPSARAPVVWAGVVSAAALAGSIAIVATFSAGKWGSRETVVLGAAVIGAGLFGVMVKLGPGAVLGTLVIAGTVAGFASRSFGVPGVPTALLVLAGLMGVYVWAREARTHPPDPLVTLPLLVLMAAVGVAAVRSSLPPAQDALATLTLVAPVGFFVYAWLAERGSLRRLLVALAGISSVAGLVIAVQSVLGIGGVGVDQIAANAYLSSTGGTIYLGGFVGYVEAATFLAAGALAAIGLIITSRSPRARLLAGAAAAVSVSGLLLTERRTEYLAFAVGLIVVAALVAAGRALRASQWIGIAAALALVSIIVLQVLGPQATTRLSSLSGDNASLGIEFRSNQYSTVLAAVGSEPVGYGSGAAVQADRFGASSVTVADSYWGVLAIETGIVGLLAAVTLTMVALWRAVGRAVSGRWDLRVEYAVAAGILACLAFANLGANATYALPASFVFWATVGACCRTEE